MTNEKMTELIKDSCVNGFRDKIAKQDILDDLLYHYRRARDETIETFNGGLHPVPRSLLDVAAIHHTLLAGVAPWDGVEFLVYLYGKVQSAPIKTVN